MKTEMRMVVTALVYATSTLCGCSGEESDPADGVVSVGGYPLLLGRWLEDEQCFQLFEVEGDEEDEAEWMHWYDECYRHDTAMGAGYLSTTDGECIVAEHYVDGDCLPDVDWIRPCSEVPGCCELESVVWSYCGTVVTIGG